MCAGRGDIHRRRRARFSTDSKVGAGEARKRVHGLAMDMDPSSIEGPIRSVSGGAHGLTRRQLQGLRYQSLARGVVFRHGTALDVRTRCEGLRLILPGPATFSHFTAAELHGVPAPRDRLVHVSLISETEPRIRGVAAHRVLELPEPWWISGLPVTTPGRTFVDLAAKLDLYGLVEAGDQLVRRDPSMVTFGKALDAGVKRRGIIDLVAAVLKERRWQPA